MMVFKRKQVVVLSLILMIVVAGYLQYSYNKGSASEVGKEIGKNGEAVFVDNLDAHGSCDDTEKKSNKAENTDKAQNDIGASKQANDFFAQAKLNRQITREKNSEALKALAEDPNADKDTKKKANDERLKAISNSEKEMKMETLIKNKGFSDVIVLFSDEGRIDVVVKAPNLTSAYTAQIADIVSRQANVDMDKIVISNKY